MIDSNLAETILKEMRMERAKKFQESPGSKEYKPGEYCPCGNSKLHDMDMCVECYEYQQKWEK